MIAPPIPKNEKERLAELLQYDILDTPQEEELNEIVALASSICKMPMSLISLIDEDRQWFKAKVGLAVEETPRELAFCAYAINGDEIFSVPDAQVDDRFTKNPMVVGDPNIRFYAGVPLTTPGGYNLGTLCVIDREPRTLNAEQQVALRTLARQVVTHFELRKKNRKLHLLLKTIDQQKAQLENHNQVLARLLSIISHDLRTPVENLKQLFNMFISGELTTEELAMLGESLNKSLNTTSELLQNLLSWASSQLKDAGLNISNIDLHELVNEQLHAIELSARTKQNTLINEVKPGTRIDADSDILKFVVRNLVINANKFTVHGKVKISFDTNTDRHRIKVADTGRGMSQEAINRLFNWKNRQTSDGTAGEKGSGLGLLITKQFAVQHGGDLIFESREGEGTTVTFEISSQLVSEQQL